jgi:diphthamide synthase subunit DPH2
MSSKNDITNEKKQKTITICGSIDFLSEMKKIKSKLEKQNYKVFIPEEDLEKRTKLTKQDLIKNHFGKIKESDSILVVNETKNGKENYIGANTLMEMAVAFNLEKSIYIYNDLPKDQSGVEEIQALNPFCLKKDLENLYPHY